MLLIRDIAYPYCFKCKVSNEKKDILYLSSSNHQKKIN